MRLTTKGRFAVTAMIDLALNSGEGPVTLAAISERQKISLSYLEQLFDRLRPTAWLKACAGRGAAIVWRGRTRTSRLPMSSALSMKCSMPPSAAACRTVARRSAA